MNKLFSSIFNPQSAIRSGILAVIVLPLLVSSAAAQAALGGATGGSGLEVLSDSPALGVQDRAGLFPPEDVVKAREAIQDFRREYHRDLFIETFPQVPAPNLKRVKSMWHRSSERYFADWAQQRAQALGVDGVYVLICNNPRHVQVLVHPQAPEQAFSSDDARELRSRLERQLPRSPGTALLNAVSFVRETVDGNLADRESATKSIRFETIAAILGGAVAFWLLLSLVRAILNRRSPASRDATAPVGLAAGFLGALFGTTAGYWMYDRVFRSHAPAAPRPESEFLQPPPPVSPAESAPVSEYGDQEASTHW